MIFTLVVGLTLALLLGILAQRCKLSPLVGYLVAGMIAAQPWWGEPVDGHVVEDFSHIGVVLLLFGVGLQFHFKDLLAVQRVAVPGALVCMLLVTLAGAAGYFLFGIGQPTWRSCLMFGLCICVSSTVVLTRVLTDNRVMQTPAGYTALGWLVVEDMFTIVLLVLLPVLFGDSGQSLGEALVWMIIKLTGLVLVVTLVARKLMRTIFTYVARSASGELFTLTVLVSALGIAVLSAKVFNASMEFGAFLSGMVVGQSKFASRAASDALPMRDAFAVLFFVSVGMGFSFGGLLEYWPLALATLFATMVVKPLGAFCIVRMLGKSVRKAMLVGGSLSQIGEFSFILATLVAGTYKLMPMSAVNVITGVAIISITINAACYRFVPAFISALEKRGIGLPKRGENDLIPPPGEDRHRIIVVGYGPCGQLLTGIFRKYDMEVVIIEMNIDTVNRLAAEKIPAILGDARLRHILKTAGVEKAVAIVISAPGAPSTEITATARELNPEIRVVANTSYIRTARELMAHDRNVVFSGEAEASLSMATHVLQVLGATEEQLSRERQEARNTILGLKPGH
ncbi:MAG: cation:proton antiporter [Akkermansia sp.]|nr:cation:proton antiporter [Akkermansia sp.]